MTITIEVKGDSQQEADETFDLDLFGDRSHSGGSLMATATTGRNSTISNRGLRGCPTRPEGLSITDAFTGATKAPEEAPPRRRAAGRPAVRAGPGPAGA